MSDKPNEIAAIERAISKKYGDSATRNPKANWCPEKEREYLQQSKELYEKVRKNDEWQEKIEVNGVKVSKKLLNRESLISCSVCRNFAKGVMDDVCLSKFNCCNACYINYVEGREDRWMKGWRPQNEN
jgi:hypothetical protein